MTKDDTVHNMFNIKTVIRMIPNEMKPDTTVQPDEPETYYANLTDLSFQHETVNHRDLPR